jgi:hypothetical protein
MFVHKEPIDKISILILVCKHNFRHIGLPTSVFRPDRIKLFGNWQEIG